MPAAWASTVVRKTRRGSATSSSDTAATDELWERANALANLKAVFLEMTFPDSLSRLADLSKHLTPAQFRQEIQKLQRAVPVIVVHIKARESGE